MAHQTITRDGYTVRVYRYGFLRPGFYAEATDATGNRAAFTEVFSGKGSKQRCIEAAFSEAKSGQPGAGDRGPTW